MKRFNIKVIEGRSYLPMRAILEELNETVGWEEATKRAYISRGNLKMYVDGIIIENRTYVKTRELEKLGYTIGWDESTREVRIEKNLNKK